MSGGLRSSGFLRVPVHCRWIAPLLFLSLAGFFSSRILEERARDPGGSAGIAGGRGILHEVSRRPSFALGFRNVLADFVWLQAVQVAGNREMTAGDYTRLYDLLNAVANFDPKFAVPYILGGLVLGESPGHAREAVRILERGRENRPDDWRFPFYIGFTRYFSLGDPPGGGEAMAEAARLPGCPAYLAGVASRMLSEAREPEAALALLAAMAGQESDPLRRSVLARRIREVTVERDLQLLERGVEQYRARTGSLPGELSDLVRAGILPAIPQEPNGGKYLLEKGGTVRSDRVAERLRVYRKI
jgi:hypothetical protein